MESVNCKKACELSRGDIIRVTDYVASKPSEIKDIITVGNKILVTLLNGKRGIFKRNKEIKLYG